jgi:hypothetical protein
MSAAPVLTQLKKITLQIGSGPIKGKVFEFEKPLIKIGRGQENDVVLNQDSKISRVHVEIQQIHGLVQIHNVSEKNSMKVNGKVTKSAILDGDSTVLIGETCLNFFIDLRRQAVNRPMVVHSQVPMQVGNQHLPQQQAPHPLQPNALSTSPNQFPQSHQPMQAFQHPQQSPIAVKLAPQGSSKVLFYSVIALMLFAGTYVFFKPIKHPKKPIGLKTTEEYQGEVDTSTKSTELRKKELEKMGENTIQYELAQQQYIKGFRDYEHQQYGRAISSLQTALSYYPQHELAHRYLSLARKKLDEVVQQLMDAGAKYKSEGNYRMCKSSYSNVLRTLEDTKDKNYQAAEQYFKECEAEERERY